MNFEKQVARVDQVVRRARWPLAESALLYEDAARAAGQEIVVWAGANGNDPTATGERWAP